MRATVSTRAWQVLAVLIALMSCGFFSADSAWGATAKRFGSPGDHPYRVPAGVTRITVTAVGAAGGNCTPGHGGKGATITATVPVRPGEKLVVGVGAPGSGCNRVPASGGFGGGGTGGAGHTRLGSPGAGGGGASFVAPGTSSRSFLLALVVAGGGGGSSDFSPTVGVNGGNAGSPGRAGARSGSGGRAGGQSRGGAGGAAGSKNAHAGLLGSLEFGGAGGRGATNGVSVGGGGGGGGYYGGGGGGGGAKLQNPGGGGGGSSHVIAGATHVSGPRSASGTAEVIITPVGQRTGGHHAAADRRTPDQRHISDVFVLPLADAVRAI